MTSLDPCARRALEWPGPPEKPAADCTTAEARAQYLARFAEKQKPLEDVAEILDLHAGRLRLKVWRGNGAPGVGAPALLYLHGGGFVIGAPETHEDICRSLANAVGGVVVSPDYRLAPDHAFPAAIEDCVEALRWMVAAASVLAIDPSRIVVAGDSAGGNLAAVVALMARDGNAPAIAGQILIYPVTDQRQLTDSYRRHAEGFGLSALDMRWFRARYLPDEAGFGDWRASPLLAPSLAAVAPALVILAGHDVLFDEGRAYAERLETEARASLRIWPGQIHGFVSMGGAIPEAREALGAVAGAWREMHAAPASSSIV